MAELDPAMKALGFTAADPSKLPSADLEPAPNTPEPGQTMPGSTMEQGSEWRSAGFSPGKAPAEAPPPSAPSRFQGALTKGASVLSSIGKVMGTVNPALGASLHNMVDDMTTDVKSYIPPNSQFEDEMTQGTADTSKQGWGDLHDAYSALTHNMPLLALNKALMGGTEVGLAPFFGFATAAGNLAGRAAGNKEFGDKVGIAISLVSPFPEARPAMITKDGALARTVMQNGQIETKVAGKSPTAADFHAAAQDVVKHANTVAGVTTDLEGQPAPNAAQLEFHFGPIKNADPAIIEQNMRHQWEVAGVHPAEAAAAAKASPAAARDLSAAASPVLPLADSITPHFLQNMDKHLNQVYGGHLADQGEMLNRLKAMGKIDPEFDAKLAAHMEGDPFYEVELTPEEKLSGQFNGNKKLVSSQLTPEEGAWYNEHIMPMKREERDLFERLRQTDLDVNDVDPTYMHRMVKGKTPEMDRLAGEGQETNPVYGGGGIGITSRHASSLEARSFFVAQSADGERQLVRMTNDGKHIEAVKKASPEEAAIQEQVASRTDEMKLLKKRRAALAKGIKENTGLKGDQDLVDQIDKELADHKIVLTKAEADLKALPGGRQLQYDSEKPLRVGETMAMNGKEYSLVSARIREIEAETKVRYYHTGVASTIDNLLHLRAADRMTQFATQLRDSEEYRGFSTAGAGKKPDWVKPQFPLFSNDYMDPKMANRLDDFYGVDTSNPITRLLEKGNNAAIGSMFWTFVPHASNEAAFGMIDRGFDNFTPRGLHSLFVDSAKGLYDTLTQSPLYQQVAREGGSLHYGPIANRDFMTQMLTHVGQSIEKHPEGWDGLAKAIGLKSGAQLASAYYSANRNALWAISDMRKMQRVRELMRKGMDVPTALSHAERFTPVYRIPTEFPTYLGGRDARQVYDNSLLFEFSKYHYDIMRFHFNMFRDLLGPSATASERIHALGSLTTLIAYQTVLAPAINAATQYLTGNDHLRVPVFGPAKVTAPLFGMLVNHTQFAWPKFIKDYYKDNGAWLDALRGLMPMSPAAQVGFGVVSNTDMWSGRNIMDPSDMRNGNIGANLKQAGNWLASKAVEPYNAFSEAWQHNQAPGETLVKNIMGWQVHTPEEEAAKEKAFKYQDRAAKSRLRHPLGPLEGLGN